MTPHLTQARHHRISTTQAAPVSASTIPCPGAHNDAARNDERDDEPDLVYCEPVWCEHCATSLRSALLYLPGLAAALEVEIEEATDVAPERVSGTRARALHEHQAQALLIDEIRDILAQFEDEVRDWRALTPRRRDVRQRASIQRSARFLANHFEWIVTKAPDTADPQGLVRAFIDKLKRLDRRAMNLTHQQDAKPEECLGVPCKRLSCGLKTLVRAVEKTGADKGEIVCESCGNKLTLDQYRDWAVQWGIYEYAHLDDEQREHYKPAVAAYERTRVAA
jgi:hypothetical protein